MALQFGVFDHIEPIPGQELDQIYRDRLSQVDMFDAAGFYAYHLAEHHTPAVHSLAPSQNVFLAAAARSTRQIKPKFLDQKRDILLILFRFYRI